MALGGRFFREFDEDPFFRDAASNGLPTTFMDPFGMFGPGRLGPHGAISGGPQVSSRELDVRRDPFAGMGMWPFGNPFMGAQSMFSEMTRVPPSAGSHSYSSTSVMHYSSLGGEGGAPRVYHATSSTRQAGGLRETRKSVRDSQSGIQKMSIGHHIGDRSRTVEKKYNTKTKEQEEHQEFVNLDETDAPTFDREWEEKTQPYNHHRSLEPSLAQRRRHHADTRGLPAALASSHHPSSSGHVTMGKRKHRSPSFSNDFQDEEQVLPTGGAGNEQKHFHHYRSPSPPHSHPTATFTHARPSVPSSHYKPVPERVGPSSRARAGQDTQFREPGVHRKSGAGKTSKNPRVHFSGTQL